MGCGQTCVAVKRVYVVGDPAPWAEALAKAARALRVGDPSTRGDRCRSDDLIARPATGSMRMVQAAVAHGATVLAGGEPLDRTGSFYPPTVLVAGSSQAEDALAGAFGPVVIVPRGRRPRRGRSGRQSQPVRPGGQRLGRGIDAAAQHVAGQLQAGMVTVNDAVTPTAHAAAPFGGVQGERVRPHQGLPGPPRIRPAAGRLRPIGRRVPAATVPLSRDPRARAVLLDLPVALPLPAIASARRTMM